VFEADEQMTTTWSALMRRDAYAVGCARVQTRASTYVADGPCA